MGTKVNSNYESLLTFTRASKGHALRPVSYGDELVTNGTFDDSSALNDWEEFSGTLSVASQKLRVTQTTGSNPSAGQTVNTTVGKIYVLSLDYFPDDANAQILVKSTNISGSILYNEQNLTSDGTYRNVFVATKSSIYIQLVAQSSTTGHYAEFDNVSLKEVIFDQPDGTLTLFEHPDDVPRVEWDSAGNALGLLVEEQRTNLVTYSEDFTVQAGRWTNGQEGGASLTSGLTESPDRSDSVWKLYATSGTGTQLIQQNPTVSGATTVSASVYLKKAEYKYGGIRLLDSSQSAGYSVFIDLDDGSVFDTSTRGTPTVSDYSVQDVGNGWWRLSVITSSDGGEVNFTVAISDGTLINSFDVVSFVGDGTSGIYIYGAQVEAGSFPTSYMKNEGTSSGVTRSADVASIPVADFGYNHSEGTVNVEIDPLTDTLVANPMAYQLNDGTTSERLTVFGSASSWRFVATDGGVQQSSITSGTFGTAKIASSFEQNKFNHCVNGTLGTEDTSGTMPTITELGLGNQNGSNLLNGHIKSIKYYPRRLTNAQLQDLTS